MGDIFSIFPLGPEKVLHKLSNPKKATIYYYGYSLNLLNGKKERASIFDYLNLLDDKTVKNVDSVTEVHHLYYELAEVLLFKDCLKFQNEPLAIEILYCKKVNFSHRSLVKDKKKFLFVH